MQPSIDERLWPRLVEEDRGYATPCWIWTGGLDGQGYGKIFYEGRLQGVHVVVYKLLIGPVPKGKELDHLCRVRSCARLLHLEPVTPLVNKQRGMAGAYEAAKTHCPRGHPYSGDNLRIYSSKRQKIMRACLTCRRAWRPKMKTEEMTDTKKTTIKDVTTFGKAGIASGTL